jgi:hypothetical protein
MLTLEQAYEQQVTYQAAPQERAKIAGVTMVAFVGGVAVGKNYLMHESGFAIVGRQTSRPPRAGDDPAIYTYSTNTEMLDAIEHGLLIQYGVHLPDLIYGSRTEDYRTDGISVGDFWFDSVDGLRSKGFKKVLAISVLTKAEQWKDYLDDRFYDRPPQYAIDRLNEAEQSIRWSLEQHQSGNPDHLLVVNDDAQTAGNLDRIRKFASGEQVEPLSSAFVTQTAQDMLNIIHSYKQELS